MTSVQPPLYHEWVGMAGPRLAFLPGLAATTRYWRSRVEPLAGSHRLLLIDLLGFGRSAKPWTTYTVDRHVAALHEVLAPHGPLTLVGHSFGAIASTAYAAQHPDVVERLILISLPAFSDEGHALTFFRQRRLPDRWLLGNMAFAAVTCVLTRRLMKGVLRRLARDLPSEVVEDLVQHTWRSSTSTLWEGVYRHDVVRDIARLPKDMPLLLLHGEADETAPLSGLHRVLEAHAGARLLVLRGGDHHPVLRRPDFVLGAIQEFVDGGPAVNAHVRQEISCSQ